MVIIYKYLLEHFPSVPVHWTISTCRGPRMVLYLVIWSPTSFAILTSLIIHVCSNLNKLWVIPYFSKMYSRLGKALGLHKELLGISAFLTLSLLWNVDIIIRWWHIDILRPQSTYTGELILVVVIHWWILLLEFTEGYCGHLLAQDWCWSSNTFVSTVHLAFESVVLHVLVKLQLSPIQHRYVLLPPWSMYSDVHLDLWT